MNRGNRTKNALHHSVSGTLWGTGECPPVLQTAAQDLLSNGFKLNPYDPCVVKI